MNRTVFKNGLIWNNIGEVAVVTYKNGLSVYQSAHFGFDTMRQRVHPFTFQLR